MSTTTSPSTLIPTGTWTVDPAHSKVGFAVKHMGIATVRGEFTDFQGALEIGEDPSTLKVYGTVKAESVDTNEPQRDDHLRSPDFFDAGSVSGDPFESTSIEALDDEEFRITGELTIHGETNEIVLHADVQGTDVDPWGNERVGLEVSRPAIARRLRYEVQPGARQRQHAGGRQGQARARHLRRQAVRVVPSVAGRRPHRRRPPPHPKTPTTRTPDTRHHRHRLPHRPARPTRARRMAWPARGPRARHPEARRPDAGRARPVAVGLRGPHVPR